jgi:hypothetical protein
VNSTPVRVSDITYAEDATERKTSAMWMRDGDVAIINQGLQQQGPGGGPVSIDCTARYVGGKQL